MQPIYLLLVLASGSGLAFQAPINARLRDFAGSPLAGALISFAVGTLLLLGAVAATGATPFPAERLRTAPWWIYTGGALGVLYVVSAIVAVPRIGATMLLAAAVAGQMIGALCIDHFGWFGLDQNPVTPRRILGAGLLGLAMWCLRK